MSILVFVPILSYMATIPSGNISCVEDILTATSAIMKQKDLRLEDREILFSQLSLLLLVSDRCNLQQYALQLRLSYTGPSSSLLP